MIVWEKGIEKTGQTFERGATMSDKEIIDVFKLGPKYLTQLKARGGLLKIGLMGEMQSYEIKLIPLRK